DDDRRVVDPEKEPVEPVGGAMPARIALPFRELEDLQGMAVRIPEVEGLDSSRVLVPVRQPLRAGGGVLDLVLAKPAGGCVRVPDDDRDVLEGAVIAAKPGWDRPAPRSQVLGQLDGFL